MEMAHAEVRATDPCVALDVVEGGATGADAEAVVDVAGRGAGGWHAAGVRRGGGSGDGGGCGDGRGREGGGGGKGRCRMHCLESVESVGAW